jgi:hypothetical protein
MKRSKLLAGAAITAALSACVPVGEDPSAVAFETLARGGTYQPGCTAQHDDRLIRNQADWAAFWDQVHVDPAPPLPAVDFSRDTVLANCGQRSDPGEYSTIDAVRLGEGAPASALVSVTDTSLPGIFPMVIVYGYHAVRVSGVIDAAQFVHVRARGPQMRVETLAVGESSGCDASSDQLISTPGEWAAFWSALHAGREPEPLRPSVDFSTQSVLASCLGARPSGGYQVRITEVRTTGEVAVRETQPGPNCAVTLAQTQPYHLISVDRRLDSATFTRSTTVQDCPP